MDGFDILRILQYVVVIGAAIGALHQWVVRPIAAAIHKQAEEARKQAEESRKLTAVVGDVIDIRKELKRNGGASLRDAVIRIEEGMNELKGRMDAHIDLHLQKGDSE